MPLQAAPDRGQFVEYIGAPIVHETLFVQAIRVQARG